MLGNMNGIFVALLVIGVAFAIDLTGCKKDCNDLSNDNSKVLFYGTDDENHLITYSKASGTGVMKCYRTCGVTAVYPGVEGCPNYCSSYYGQGHCWEDSCQCNDGWTGPDCSIVTCPNGCSNHGVCVNNSCQCEPGYFSNDCSSPIVSLEPYPFGQWVHDRPYYSPTDKYRDSHPIFNTSTISQFRITMSDDDLQYLLLPENQYDQKYVECTMTFQNQIISETRQVGIRLKGQSTPEYLKKGWKINFLKYGEEGSFYGLDYLGLKYPYPDDSMLRNQLYMDLNRAFNVPVFRASFATLWINDIYRGVYWLQEEMDENFIKARYEFSNGNFYRNGAPGAFFGYLGDNPETYKNLTVFNRGENSNVYEQESGNGDFSDLTQFIQILNSTSLDFADKIVQVFDVDRYLRALAVEVFTINVDSYHRNGNNWCLYFNPETKQFEFFGHDFDFAMKPSNGIEGFVYNDSSVKAVLSVRLLQVPEFKNNFTKYLEMIMNLNLTQLHERTNVVRDLIFPQLKEDLFYRLDWGRTDQSFFDDKEYVNNFFPRRSNVVKGQLENYSEKQGFGANMMNTVKQGAGNYVWIVIAIGGAFSGIVIGTILFKRKNNYEIIKG